MPKVYITKKARKDYPEQDIKKGDTFYYWAFKNGPLIRSKTKPRQSQLTMSSYKSQAFALIERAEDFTPETIDDIEPFVDELKNDIESLRDETQEKLDNMPEGLRDADTGVLLQERIDTMENWISELDSVEIPELDLSSVEEEIKADYKDQPLEEEKLVELIEERKQEITDETIQEAVESIQEACGSVDIS